MVYRGSVSFILAARAEGELIDNNQVVLMMRLSLCMVWLSIFQHILVYYPAYLFISSDALTPTSSLASISENSTLSKTDSEKEVPIQRSSSSFQAMRDWLFHKLVRNSYQELDDDDTNDMDEVQSELIINNS